MKIFELLEVVEKLREATGTRYLVLWGDPATGEDNLELFEDKASAEYRVRNMGRLAKAKLVTVLIPKKEKKK